MAGRKPIALRDRFYEKLVKGSPNQCWAFRGYHHKGYAIFSIGHKKHHAIRVAYELEFGPIPEGTEIDHTCPNPWCCNPRHGEPVSHSENMKRAWARGGRIRRHYVSLDKFTAFMADPRSWQEKAVAFGVSKSTAHRWAKNGVQKRWHR